MSQDEAQRRNSRALEPELISDPIEKAEAEARNGLRQYDAGIALIQECIDRRQFRLRVHHVLGLQRIALEGLSAYAGNFRPANVEIQGSNHHPVGAHLVPELVEEMCDYVNDGWDDKKAVHLAAYVMWRLNWIHPFADGNGRTSRILSYVVLSCHLNAVLPGTPTIPDQIVDNRDPYFRALDAADEKFKEEKIDVSEMENLIAAMLAKQLLGAYQEAGGTVPNNTAKK